MKTLKAALMIVVLSFIYPAGFLSAQEGKFGIPVSKEMYNICMAKGCFVVPEDALDEVLKNIYAAGYMQCKKETRI